MAGSVVRPAYLAFEGGRAAMSTMSNKLPRAELLRS
jgi:hypothetical protein